jgi:1-acyl-sn-glycerol-3-phosphate acyltransferase
MLYEVLKPVTRGLARLAFGLEAHGTEHVPMSGPTLVVANHSSVLDPPLIGSVTSRPVSFMAKAELFRVPLLGPLIRALNAYPVRREGGDPAALRTALRVLHSGGALLVFPEGTRGPEGVLRPGKAGAGMLAVLSGAPVIPAYVRGSGRALPRGAWLPRPAKVTVTFGPPLRFGGDNGCGRRKPSYEAASRAMMAAIARLKDAEAPGGPASPRSAVLGGVGAGGASTSSKSTQGRKEQHGEA